MLSSADEHLVMNRFGVARAQVRRDHLISHVLAAIATRLPDQVLFFGGTALSRTLVPEGRLSEDIDLIALTDRRSTAEALQRAVVSELRREYPGLVWQPTLTEVADVQPARIVTTDGLSVRVQLLNRTGYPSWPTERRSLEQRYTDAPPADLIVPTAAVFAAWKTVAWADRRASRDLFDLWSLAQAGLIDHNAADLYRRFGPTNKPPSANLFTTAPDQASWIRELAAQTRLVVTAEEALGTVRKAWLDTSSRVRLESE